MRNLFLWVPREDWSLVVTGAKTEFRTWRQNKVAKATDWICPTPVLLHSKRSYGMEPRLRLAVLEQAWEEPLGAISEESLEREGFASIAEFRTYWNHRSTKRFRPLAEVNCWRVRITDDIDECGRMLMGRLYGDFLGEALTDQA